MHFLTLPALAAFLGSATVLAATPNADSFVPKEFYLQNYAPIQLQRLADYTDAHKDTLSAVQLDFFSKAANAISTFDIATLDTIRSEANALFTAEDAAFILTGTTAADKVRNTLLGVQQSCTCSSADSWCGNNTACKSGYNGCSKTGGCGTLWTRKCDGLCVNP